MGGMSSLARCIAAVALAVCVVLACPWPAAGRIGVVGAAAPPGVVAGAAAVAAPGAVGDADPVAAGWRWPVSPAVVVAPYRAPAHAYGAGHRGIDLQAEPGSPVVAPADGMIAFAGTVVDRPLLTIDHGEGHVTTLEPVLPAVAIGARVAAGEVVGTVAAGGHTAPGAVHFGVREAGEYINPLLLLGTVPRAVLLPCC